MRGVNLVQFTSAIKPKTQYGARIPGNLSCLLKLCIKLLFNLLKQELRVTRNTRETPRAPCVQPRQTEKINTWFAANTPIMIRVTFAIEDRQIDPVKRAF